MKISQYMGIELLKFVEKTLLSFHEDLRCPNEGQKRDYNMTRFLG